MIVFSIAFLILFLGFDEPIINRTINKVDYSCNIDSDCIVKDTIRGWCGNSQCVNQDWDYYPSLVNRAFALSCRPTLITCSCLDNKCESRDLYKSNNIADCENLEERDKDKCIIVVNSNLNKSSN